MKILIQVTALFFIVLYVFISCKKDKEQDTVSPPPPPPRVNNTPIAKAGGDTSITQLTCSETSYIVLDGSLSSDPDNEPIYFVWKKISGPKGIAIKNYTRVKSYAEISEVGEYAVELTVNDAGSLFSKDTLLISVKRGSIVEYDLDITFNGTFKFLNNEQDCYYYSPCIYYDQSLIEGLGTFNSVGGFYLYFSEYTDSSSSNYAGYSNISITRSFSGIHGTSNVNLKKLYQQGGGAFSGIFKVQEGTASICKPDVFLNLGPLTVTGNVDTAARKATVRVQGKTYF